MRRQTLPPPTQFTVGDKIRLATSALVLLLGIVILWRTMPFGITAQAIVVGAAFIGFGIYRLRLGYNRLKEWKKNGGAQ